MTEKILSWLTATYEGVQAIIQWSVEHPEAALIGGPVMLTALNYIVKLTPWKGDDDLLKIVLDALSAAKASKEKRAKAK